MVERGKGAKVFQIKYRFCQKMNGTLSTLLSISFPTANFFIINVNHKNENLNVFFFFPLFSFFLFLYIESCLVNDKIEKEKEK
jgi:hypothetical protein